MPRDAWLWESMALLTPTLQPHHAPLVIRAPHAETPLEPTHMHPPHHNQQHCPFLLRPVRLQTTKAHITVLGGVVEELVADAGLVVTSDNPFKASRPQR